MIADWLIALTTAKKTWGFGLCFLHLRNVKGFGWNHKRGYRIYREHADQTQEAFAARKARAASGA